MTTTIHWFRRDLRLADNTALAHAASGGERLVPVFVLDDAILARRDTGAARVRFLLGCLHALADALAAGMQVPVERLMVTLADREVFSRFLAAYRNRVRRRSRPWFWATTLVGLARSRRRDGYLAIRANL